jgi:hypothetical protein
LGPLHTYVVTGAVPECSEESVTEPPSHATPLLPALALKVLTVTVVEPVAIQLEPGAVTVKLYTPAIDVVMLLSVASGVVAVVPGPLHE